MFSSIHFSTLGWLAVTGGALAIGLNKGGLTGLGVLPILLFAVVFPARESTGFVLPLLVVGDLCAIGVYRRVVIWKVFWTLLLPALAGVALGYTLMGRISERAFGPLIGWIILGLIAVQLARSWLGRKLDSIFESREFGLAMGVLAGMTTMIANAAGPVANLYFLSVRLPKWNLIGTSAWFFFVINLWKIPFSARLGLTNAYSLSLGLWLAPLVILGFFGGRFLAAKMPQKIFDTFLLICTGIGAVRLVWPVG
ncbi:MAG TPA: sulfite exporter TauE/SafE family protein [Candidatus Methylacidiphilales bacterium]|nr:sulfite exporter TauE/SafE family protein [Candidatus Methylacidiphilales bacterium]